MKMIFITDCRFSALRSAFRKIISKSNWLYHLAASLHLRESQDNEIHLHQLTHLRRLGAAMKLFDSGEHPLRQRCSQTRLAESSVAAVDVCECGVMQLHVGA